ncbi:MAG: hypothetical protein AVDCRST_MAG73-507, partial [uncultured Thermomicrobiales bacterium]
EPGGGRTRTARRRGQRWECVAAMATPTAGFDGAAVARPSGRL